MGLVEWFLRIHFSWGITKSTVDVHMNQSGFAANLIEQFCHDKWEPTPDANPYCSGVPIDSIAPSKDTDDSPAQIQHTEAYQSLVEIIGWLAGATCPDIAPVHSFLASYSSKPSTGHMKAAIYVLRYITELLSLLPSLPPSIHTFTFRLLLTWRHIPMLVLHLGRKAHLSPHTVMPVGDLRLVLQFVMGLSFLFSNELVAV
jgi:hypothetical protein